MLDPLEGVTPHGTIQTGANRNRVPPAFEPVLAAAVDAVSDTDGDPSLYLYGSVATGMAQPPQSDVDLLSAGLPSAAAAAIARSLSLRFSDLCRAVEVAPAEPTDFSGDTDEPYGGRVFLRHYCVHLAGPNLHSAMPEYPADRRAARSFNGDIAQHAKRWRQELEAGRDLSTLGRRLARKSLLAVAGLVSVHDQTWTTDRATSAARWAEIEPGQARDLELLMAWSRDGGADRSSVADVLDGVVAHITASFQKTIGLWEEEPGR